LPWADLFHAFGVTCIAFPDTPGQAGSGTLHDKIAWSGQVAQIAWRTRNWLARQR